MKLDDICTIQRALGIIEGVAWGMKEPAQSALNTAVEMISEIIDKEDANDA